MDASDVNGDGKLDVVTSSAFSDAEVVAGTGAYGGYLVSVLEGDGSGNLAPPAVYRMGSDAYSFAVGDLSGTGRPDIVAISETESDRRNTAFSNHSELGLVCAVFAMTRTADRDL